MHTNIDRMRIIRIEEIIEETPTVRTLAFRDEISSRAGAGQFLMVWMPGAEELPMSVMIWHEKSSAAFNGTQKGIRVNLIIQQIQRRKVRCKGALWEYI